MLDLKNKQSIYDNLAVAKNNKELFELAGTIAREHNKAIKQALASQKEQHKEKASADITNLTDAELTQRVKTLLVQKLADGSISAAEIAQTKDLFGMTASEQDITIQTINYSSLCSSCPKLAPSNSPKEEPI